jgi:Rod binding domain-containing protein
MTAIGPISTSRAYSPVGPLPPGTKPPSTPEQRALYDSCKQFEGVFVKQLVSGWMKSARGDDAPEGAQGIYQDMADDTMTSSLVDGGTFGLAGTMYAQLATRLQNGSPVPTLTPPADAPTPTDPTAGGLPTDAPTDAPADPAGVLGSDPAAGGATA